MHSINKVEKQLINDPKTWLVTGAAGFIGSNLVKRLLQLNQKVIGLDNLSTGYKRNIEQVVAEIDQKLAGNFQFIHGDIRDPATCRTCCQNIDFVLHQAALGSVPRSMKDPIATNQSNVDGFLNMLVAARDQGVKRFVYASSSSVYGDNMELPKVEDIIGSPLSPYAVSKYTNELYAKVFHDIYGLATIGLRYFNVFGPRQDPDGAYAAVIPKWFAAILKGEPVYIYGDGESSRDFCYIENVVQANLLAACTSNTEAVGQVYNIAYSQKTTLNDLFFIIRDIMAEINPAIGEILPVYRDFRPGDVRHSLADISKAVRLLGYRPTHSLIDGIHIAASWYIDLFK